ncbi:hypothetical protein OIU78_002357 [Salix suchowensis]|nr:hypothetical protein OIU78_002357 [Salix suchowensis]
MNGYAVKGLESMRQSNVMSTGQRHCTVDCGEDEQQGPDNSLTLLDKVITVKQPTFLSSSLLRARKSSDDKIYWMDDEEHRHGVPVFFSATFLILFECKIPEANLKPVKNANGSLATEIFFAGLLDAVFRGKQKAGIDFELQFALVFFTVGGVVVFKRCR